MSACMFPGQGSQIQGMGKALFRTYPDLLEEANSLLGYDLEALCLENPQNRLNQTQYTQPAIYVVNALSWMDWLAEGNAPPDFLAGHSLGEYNALLAAGVFDFETGLRLVIRRAALMAQASGGSMAAVIGMSPETIQTILDSDFQTLLHIANDNSPTQTVIAGANEAIIRARSSFLKAGAKRYMMLPVSGAFHSPAMQDAASAFGEFPGTVRLQTPTRPVIANVNGLPYQPGRIAETLAQQIAHPVRWQACIRYMLDHQVTRFTEIGPGRVLSSLVAQIRQSP